MQAKFNQPGQHGSKSSYPTSFQDLNWPAVLDDPQALYQAVLTYKDFHQLEAVTLPLHDDPFLRALGLDLIYDWDLGIRVKAAGPGPSQAQPWSHRPIQVYQDLIRQLQNQSILVTLEVSGIFSVASNLQPMEDLIRMTRKDPQGFQQIMETCTSWILQWLDWMGTVDQVYYADATGGVDIVGPRFYGAYLGPWTHRLLSQVPGQVPLLLCPRTFFSLEILDRVQADPQGRIHRSLCSSQSLLRPQMGSYRLIEERTPHV